ncbi:MAG: TIGR00296 family protein [Candidatus Hodarchaeales archaeon]|jgi:uncharacterized protein (TIGR00296 family)
MSIQLEDFSSELGNKMILYARKVLETYLSKQEQELPPLTEPSILQNNAGIFCTLKKAGQLRGCIGYPYPTYPLGKALVKASIQSAVQDPRFNPVKYNELDKIKIELTVLTPPQLLKVSSKEDYYKKIEIGRDGLIAEYRNNRGLLLPQVPIEQKWSIIEFLAHTCQKAGIPSDLWQDTNKVKFFIFQGKIFEEKIQ